MLPIRPASELRMAGSISVILLALAALSPAIAQTPGPGQAVAPAVDEAMHAAQAAIGRTATPAEVKAWDIDVRPDFKGLPPGEGDVALGETVWEAKCTSCHGVFGESNEVFTPIVGGTTEEDIKTGRVESLVHGGSPHRTTLMKLSKLSTLWDYINRAMPWNAPKSLKTDEVYGLVAYILNLGDIVPADFTLSDRNMAETQELLPNRNGKVTFAGLWETHGKPDVSAGACMKDCSTGDGEVHLLPVEARGTHGDIARQVRLFGETRGTSTGGPEGANGAGEADEAVGAAKLVKAYACTTCHGIANRIVGPGFEEIGHKYSGKDEAVPYLVGKMMKGGQGVWGTVAMPAQAQLTESDARTIATWIAGGTQ